MDGYGAWSMPSKEQLDRLMKAVTSTWVLIPLTLAGSTVAHTKQECTQLKME
jgi:hypothetical protein